MKPNWFGGLPIVCFKSIILLIISWSLKFYRSTEQSLHFPPGWTTETRNAQAQAYFLGNTSELAQRHLLYHKASSCQPLWSVCQDFVISGNIAVALKYIYKKFLCLIYKICLCLIYKIYILNKLLSMESKNLSALLTHPCACKSCFEAGCWIKICQNSI